jgi:hypothetical protein
LHFSLSAPPRKRYFRTIAAVLLAANREVDNVKTLASATEFSSQSLRTIFNVVTLMVDATLVQRPGVENLAWPDDLVY